MKKIILNVLATTMSFMVMVGCGATSTNNTNDKISVESSKKSESNKSKENDNTEAIDKTKTTVNSEDAFDAFKRPIIKQKGEPFRIAILHRVMFDGYPLRTQRQVEIECAHRGWDLETIVYEQDAAFRDAFLSVMNKGVDAIIIANTNNMEAKLDLVKQARDAGIGIYNCDNELVEGVISNCTMNNAMAAVEIMTKIGLDYNWNCGVGIQQLDSWQVCRERYHVARGFLDNCYPNFKMICEEDLSPQNLAGVSQQQWGYDSANAMWQQHSDELDLILTTDYAAMGIAEAVNSAGNDMDLKVAGFDGADSVWTYIRDPESCFAYSYAQPFEKFAHSCCEIIDQIQIQGLNPGEEGCLIPYSQYQYTVQGFVVDKANVPNVGDSIHAVFNYYGEDPNNKDAWYNWTDGPGIYQITDGKGEK